MPDQDAGTLARAARGDLDAFDAVVRAHQDRIHNFLYRLTGNGADAEDLAQDVFLKAFQALPRFNGGPAKLSGWLFTIAVNAARSHGRHLSVVRRVTPVSRDTGGSEGNEMEIPAPANGPVENLAKREEIRRLSRWVAELDPELKEALLLREQEGLDYAAIAEALEIPVGTVKTRIHRARLALHQRQARAEKNEKTGETRKPKGESCV